MIVWANVVDIAPELSTTPAGGQTAILAMVAAQVPDESCEWGPYLVAGQSYLAAHLATLARLRGKGPVTAEAVDSLSRSYADLTTVGGTLGLTPYGVEYKRLARLTPAVLGDVP